MINVKLFVGGNGAGRQADGSTPFSFLSVANTTPVRVKKGAGKIFSIHAINVAAAVRYLKFYDTLVTPGAAGVGIPVRRYAIPASATGAGFVLAPIVPMTFTAGIVFTITTGAADSDATAPAANDVILTLEWN
jgi:hypothetical protein